MKRISKKITAIFLTMVMTVLSAVALTPIAVHATTLSETEFANKIATLQTVFVDGKYWNFYNCGNESTYTPPNRTGDKMCQGNGADCVSHGTCRSYCTDRCGKFWVNGVYCGGQCKGYANMIGYKLFGSAPNPGDGAGNGWEKITSISDYKFRAGDYVRCYNGNHSAFVTKVTSDTVFYTECNWSGPCMVKWNRNKTLSAFKSWTTYVCHYKGNELTGTGTPYNIPDTDPNPNPSTSVTLTKDTRYPTPITCYPSVTSGKIIVYSDTDLSAYPVNKRYIAYNDECTITAVYTNGYCRVRYPSGSKTAEALAKNTSFFNGGITPYAWTATAEIKSYVRSDMGTQYGSVSKNDACTVVSKSGNNVQVIYPISGGYKLGWINPSSSSVPTPTPTPTPTPSVTLTQDGRYPTPITAYPLATSGKITVYANDFSAYPIGTRNISYNDKCTINAVYTNGYCSVTYPTSGNPANALAKTSSFIVGNAGPGTWTASQKYTSFVRSDLGTQFGSVSSGDVCTIVGQNGNNKQLIYPLSSGGYKLGWINSAEAVPAPVPIPDPVVTPATPVTSDDHGLNGAVDAVEGGSDYVHVRGWAFDLDDMEHEIFVHVYIGGIAGDPNAEATPIVARDGGRSDVDNQYHCGDHHAYYANVSTSKRGTQPVYVYAIDCSDNSVSKCIGWGTVVIGGAGSGGNNNPIGNFEEVTAGEGYVYVRGWAFDKDNCDHSIFVHIYIGGVVGDANAEGHAIIANARRDDVDNQHHCGKYHGFSAKIATNKRGVQEIHAYAINIEGGSESPCIGDKTTGNIISESEPPVLQESFISNQTQEGYRVNVRVTDNVGIDRVRVATWANEGQSDLIWSDMIHGGGDWYYIDRKRSDFGVNGSAVYYNHVYIYDYSGNMRITCPDVDYKNKSEAGENVKSGNYRLVSALNPERAVDIQGAGLGNNANVQLYANTTYPEQTFDINYHKDGFYKILSKPSQKALDVAGCGYLPKTNVLQYTEGESANQDWKFVEVLDGYYAIVSRYNGLALTVQDGVDANGTNICVDTLTYDNSQLWKLRRVIDDSMVTANDVEAYENTEITPSVTVFSEDDIILEDLDYYTEVSVNGSVGTVTVTGKDNYCDSVTKSFNITYLEVPATISGDATGDGKVNMKDIVLLQQHLNGWNVELDLNAIDVNGDGKINMKDIVFLQQYLNGWDVELK